MVYGSFTVAKDGLSRGCRVFLARFYSGVGTWIMSFVAPNGDKQNSFPRTTEGTGLVLSHLNLEQSPDRLSRIQTSTVVSVQHRSHL